MDIGSPAIFAEKIALHPTVAEELVIMRTPTASDVRVRSQPQLVL
jgi:hypothetical protein